MALVRPAPLRKRPPLAARALASAVTPPFHLPSLPSPGWGTANYHPGKQAGDLTDAGDVALMLLDHLAELKQQGALASYSFDSYERFWRRRILDEGYGSCNFQSVGRGCEWMRQPARGQGSNLRGLTSSLSLCPSPPSLPLSPCLSRQECRWLPCWAHSWLPQWGHQAHSGSPGSGAPSLLSMSHWSYRRVICSPIPSPAGVSST